MKYYIVITDQMSFLYCLFSVNVAVVKYDILIVVLKMKKVHNNNYHCGITINHDGF